MFPGQTRRAKALVLKMRCRNNQAFGFPSLGTLSFVREHFTSSLNTRSRILAQ